MHFLKYTYMLTVLLTFLDSFRRLYKPVCPYYSYIGSNLDFCICLNVYMSKYKDTS